MMERKACAIAAALALASSLAVNAGPAEGGKDDKDKAKEHFLKGKELFDDGSYDQAAVEFELSLDLNAAPIVLYNLARCYDKLQDLTGALAAYQAFLDDPGSMSQQTIEEVEKRIEKIEGLVGTLVLDVAVEGVEVLVDGVSVGKTPLDPLIVESGKHAFVLRKQGIADLKKVFKVSPGGIANLSFSAEDLGYTAEAAVPGPPGAAAGGPEPVKDGEAQGGETGAAAAGGSDAAQVGESEDEGDDAGGTDDEEEDEAAEYEDEDEASDAGGEGEGGKPSAKKLGKAPFAALAGAAGAILAGAVVTGVLALHAEDDFLKVPFENQDEWRDLADRTESLALATDVLIGVGGAAAVAAIVLVFFTDFGGKDRPKVSLAPVLGPGIGGVSLEASF